MENRRDNDDVNVSKLLDATFGLIKSGAPDAWEATSWTSGTVR